MTVMRALRRMEEHGQQEGIAIIACCVAVPGTTYRWTFALRVAAGMELGSGTTVAGFALPGRLPHESLPPYIGVPRGKAPWPILAVSGRI